MPKRVSSETNSMKIFKLVMQKIKLSAKIDQPLDSFITINYFSTIVIWGDKVTFKNEEAEFKLK